MPHKVLPMKCVMLTHQEIRLNCIVIVPHGVLTSPPPTRRALCLKRATRVFKVNFSG